MKSYTEAKDSERRKAFYYEGVVCCAECCLSQYLSITYIKTN